MPLIDPAAYQLGVWKDAPIAEHAFDPSIAIKLDEQWQSFNTVASTGDWVSTQATSGTATLSTTQPGTMVLDAGATTDNQGIQIQRVKSPFVPAAGKSIWYEVSVLLTATTPPVTRAQIFIGLCAIDTTIIAAGAMTTNNRIGWQILDGGLLVAGFTCDKAGVASLTTGFTFTPATVVKLGFKYDGANDTIQQYVNGLAVGTPIATANIPKVAIYPSFVCQSDGTDQPILQIGPPRLYQLR